jgi:hypothetical protein
MSEDDNFFHSLKKQREEKETIAGLKEEKRKALTNQIIQAVDVHGDIIYTVLDEL